MLVIHKVKLSNRRLSVRGSKKIIKQLLPRFSAESPKLKGNKASLHSEFLSRKKKFITKSKEYVEMNGIELCQEGVGGTYFIRDKKSKCFAVFKPTDEEPGAINNPKNLLQCPLLPPGGGAMREVAAYLLDRNYADVPATYFIDGIAHPGLCYPNGQSHPKSGSIQRYKENIGDASTISYTRFPVEEVHRIGILDIRLNNLDRNYENILLQKKMNGQLHLVPIDHTYILPEQISSAWFDWLYWPQAKIPFSKESLSYIAQLDILADQEILKNLGFSEQHLANLEISTLFIQWAALTAHWNLHQIGKCLSSQGNDKPALLEIWVKQSNINGKFHIDEFLKVLQKFQDSNKTP